MQHHHAYVMYAPSIPDSSIPDTYKTQSPDISHITTDRLSIDDVRTLILQAQQKPFEEQYRVFVVCVRDIALEAQHALLKLLEEPPKQVLFYLVLPKTIFLLPTLRSRVHADVHQSDIQRKANEVFATFVATSYAARITQIAERTKEKDTVWIEDVLQGAEVVAHTTKKIGLLHTIMFIRTHITSKGASAKMLLEELALQLPVK